VLITAPFPGNVYGACELRNPSKRAQPAIVTVLGGGYCNTELRAMNEPRVFDYFDYVTLDAGETPLLALIEPCRTADRSSKLVRTFTRERHYVDYKNPTSPSPKPETPTYAAYH